MPLAMQLDPMEAAAVVLVLSLAAWAGVSYMLHWMLTLVLGLA
jgi:hypothetical protein